MQLTDPLQRLFDQLQILLILLKRPIVQQQLFVLALTIFLAWGVALLGRRLLQRLLTQAETRSDLPRRWWRRGRKVVRYLYSPILNLLLIQIAVWIMMQQGQPIGLLAGSVSFFWGLLAFRVLLTGLYVVWGQEAVQPYHQRILLPVFLWLVAWSLLDRLISLDGLGQLELGLLFGAPITLGQLTTAVSLLYLLIALAWAMQGGLQHAISARTGADPGVVHAVVTTSRYALISIGILLIFSTLGLNLSTFAIIGGGLSVGVGFGMQQIFANFISGILLLFEQALRPGDVIDIDGEIGIVEKLSIRSTVVRTNNNVEVIVPNEHFLTSSVTTYTKTSRLIRLLLPLGVSYESDPKLVRRVLLETAVMHDLVEADPAPTVFFTALGDSSLNFDLAVWIAQPQQIPRVRSDLYFMIWDAFQAHEIDIPFPQHDLNLGKGWERLLTEPSSSVNGEGKQNLS